MIEIRDVYKSFHVINRRTGFGGMLKDLVHPQRVERRVLNGISCSFGTGDQVCIAGRNGTGKSTLLKILAGAMTPTRGQVLYQDKSITEQSRRYKSQIGLVFGHRGQLFWELPLQESLRFLQYVYRVDGRDYNNRLEYLSEILDLATLLNVPIREMSLGQRMRSEIAGALIHTPKLLILDEATIGLDVSVKNRIYKLLSAISENEQVTVVFSTHDIHDIEKLAHRLIIVDDGRIAYDDTPRAFLDRFIQYRKVHCRLISPVPDLRKFLPSEIAVISQSDSEIDLLARTQKDVTRIVQSEIMKQVDELLVEEESFHDVLGRFYDGS